MTRQKLLNPALYQRLCQAFGRANVGVHKPGEKGEFIKTRRDGSYASFRLGRVEGGGAGEEYSVRCPACNDHRQRLYFNYRWGTRDPYSGTRILWLCHCYNEECQTEYKNRLEFAALVFDNKTEVLTANEENAVEVKARPAKMPGNLQSLKALARLQPNHPAVLWCNARQLCVHELTDRYGVGYCVLAGYSGAMVAQRIVAPFYFRSKGKVKLAGYTSRILHTDEDQPKWLHSKNATQTVIYGLAEASKYRTMFVVEGPGDKWQQGKRAAAVLGKTVKASKAKRIAKAAGAGEGNHIVVLLDPEQDKTAKLRRARHHIEVACDELRKYAQCPVSGVYLPEGSDPGSLDSDYTWDYVCRELQQKNITLSRDLK